MSKTSKLLLGTLGAAAAGVVIGLLIAPEKGSDTRKKISKSGSELKDKVSKLVQSGKDYLHDIASTMSKEADGLKSDAERHYENVKAEIN